MLELEPHRQALPQRPRGAGRGHPERCRRRDPGRRRRQRLRQEHAAAPGGRPRRRERGPHRASTARRCTGPSPKVGVVFQEPRLMPWLKVKDNVAFGLPRHLPRAERERRAAARDRARRPRRLRRRAAQDAVRRHGAARRPRPRAGDPARRAAAGRAVQRARRPDPPSRCRRSWCASGSATARPCSWSPTISTRRCSWPTALSSWAVSPGRIRLDLAGAPAAARGRATAWPWPACASGCSPSCRIGAGPAAMPAAA